MKKLVLIIQLSLIFITGCEKDNSPREKLVGKWRLIAGYNVMAGGAHSIDEEYQRIEEYTRQNIRIRYDYQGNEISRCSFRATESVITIRVEKEDGTEWESSYDYWFANDTLGIRNNGGFEFYDEYFIRID